MFRPDHILSEEFPVRKLLNGRHRRCDHGLVAPLDAHRRTHRDIRRVVSVQRLDAAILPDLLRDPDDIIGEVLPALRKAMPFQFV